MSHSDAENMTKVHQLSVEWGCESYEFVILSNFWNLAMELRFPNRTNELGDLPVTRVHQARLQWFLDHEGEILPYREIARVKDPYLTSLPKGIYKPAGWEYSLSIKETLASPYGDIPIATLPNGDWVYRYHKEEGENLRTNLGLQLCMRDRIPVGVLIQVSPKPKVEYFVAGLGRITHYADPWFDVVNWNSVETEMHLGQLVAEDPARYDGHQSQANLPGIIADIVEDRYADRLIRPNQQMFRVMLLSSYEQTCAVTQSGVIQALDAAHIRPYANKKIDSVNNGLLLRADVHRLFDNGLIGVDTRHMEAILSPKLIGTEYEEFEGRALTLPEKPSLRPSLGYLDEHRKSWNLS